MKRPRHRGPCDFYDVADDLIVRSAPPVKAPDQRRGDCLDELLRMDKVASGHAENQKLDVFFVVTVETIFGSPVQTRQPIEPVFVAAAQKPTGIGRALGRKGIGAKGGENRTVE